MNLRELWPIKPSLEVKAFVADLNTVSYASYTNQRLWIRTGNVMLVAIVWALLTNHAGRLEGLTGFLGMWCGFLLGKSGVTSLSSHGKRRTEPAYVEAKERGKAQVGVPQRVAAEPRTRRKTDLPGRGSTEPNVYQDDERADD